MGHDRRLLDDDTLCSKNLLIIYQFHPMHAVDTEDTCSVQATSQRSATRSLCSQLHSSRDFVWWEQVFTFNIGWYQCVLPEENLDSLVKPGEDRFVQITHVCKLDEALQSIHRDRDTLLLRII